MTPQLRPAQPRFRKVLACSLLSACGVLAAACGSAAAPGSPAQGGSTHSASTTAKAKVDLTIVSTAPRAIHHWTLRCDPPGGTDPDPATACSLLVAKPGIFEQTHVHVMCPMIMANADSYVISGTWFGKPVHETIIDGGCDITRWSQLHGIFN
jgi:hypothetical protein